MKHTVALASGHKVLKCSTLQKHVLEEAELHAIFFFRSSSQSAFTKPSKANNRALAKAAILQAPCVEITGNEKLADISTQELNEAQVWLDGLMSDRCAAGCRAR